MPSLKYTYRWIYLEADTPEIIVALKNLSLYTKKLQKALENSWNFHVFVTFLQLKKTGWLVFLFIAWLLARLHSQMLNQRWFGAKSDLNSKFSDSALIRRPIGYEFRIILWSSHTIWSYDQCFCIYDSSLLLILHFRSTWFFLIEGKAVKIKVTGQYTNFESFSNKSSRILWFGTNNFHRLLPLMWKEV